jgi:hypothetical protein
MMRKRQRKKNDKQATFNKAIKIACLIVSRQIYKYNTGMRYTPSREQEFNLELEKLAPGTYKELINQETLTVTE